MVELMTMPTSRTNAILLFAKDSRIEMRHGIHLIMKTEGPGRLLLGNQTWDEPLRWPEYVL